MQILHILFFFSLHRYGLLLYLLRLLQPHQPLKGILDEYLDLGRRALLQALTQQVLALDFIVTDLLLLGQEEIQPFSQGDIASCLILGALALLVPIQFQLALVFLQELHAPLH